jgi:hypothetical protein
LGDVAFDEFRKSSREFLSRGAAFALQRMHGGSVGVARHGRRGDRGY